MRQMSQAMVGLQLELENPEPLPAKRACSGRQQPQQQKEQKLSKKERKQKKKERKRMRHLQRCFKVLGLQLDKALLKTDAKQGTEAVQGTVQALQAIYKGEQGYAG
jgi:hypothetical protein